MLKGWRTKVEKSEADLFCKKLAGPYRCPSSEGFQQTKIDVQIDINQPHQHIIVNLCQFDHSRQPLRPLKEQKSQARLFSPVSVFPKHASHRKLMLS